MSYAECDSRVGRAYKDHRASPGLSEGGLLSEHEVGACEHVAAVLRARVPTSLATRLGLRAVAAAAPEPHLSEIAGWVLEREGGVWGCFGAKNEIQLNMPKFNPFFNSTFFAEMMVLHWFFNEKTKFNPTEIQLKLQLNVFRGVGGLGKIFPIF